MLHLLLKNNNNNNFLLLYPSSFDMSFHFHLSQAFFLPFDFFLVVHESVVNFHVFVKYPAFLLLSISSFILLWSEKNT